MGDSMAVGSGVSGSGVSGSDGSGSDRGSNSSGGRPPPWSIDGSSLSLAPLSTPRPTLPPLGAEVAAVRLSQDQSRLAYLVPVLRGVDQYCCIVRDIASGGWQRVSGVGWGWGLVMADSFERRLAPCDCLIGTCGARLGASGAKHQYQGQLRTRARGLPLVSKV